MGEVVRFPDGGQVCTRGRARPKQHTCKQHRRKRHKGPWKYADLCGKHPRGHPKLELGPKGRVVLAVGQVWVKGCTQELVVVKEFFVARNGLYKHDVVFAPYMNRLDADCLAEATFRGTHEVWDTWGESQKRLMEKLDYMSEHDPTSPFRGRKDAAKLARSFLGLDAQGNRID